MGRLTLGMLRIEGANLEFTNKCYGLQHIIFRNGGGRIASENGPISTVLPKVGAVVRG